MRDEVIMVMNEDRRTPELVKDPWQAHPYEKFNKNPKTEYSGVTHE